MDARLSIATADDKTLSAFQKGGSGSLTEADVDQCIEIAFKRAKENRKLL